MSKLTEQEQLKVITEVEMEMMADMFTRLSNACKAKCISSKYKDSDLSKGEGVCIDRCVAKYFEIHTLIGKKLNDAVVQDVQKQQAAVPKK